MRHFPAAALIYTLFPPEGNNLTAGKCQNPAKPKETMIHYLSEISLSEKLRESPHAGSGELPFAAIESDLAAYDSNCASWHWHEYMEFFYVVRGCMESCTRNQTLTLQPGDGCFINANALHLNRTSAEQSHAIIRVIQFDAHAIAGTGSIVQRYVRPVEQCADLIMLRLSQRDARHRAILADLASMFAAAQAEEPGYELAILQRIFHAWQLLYEIAEPILRAAPAVTDDAASRVKAMLGYIHTNYAEAISVSGIAKAASISEREAFRTFRQVLDTTPTLYLTRHRINASLRMLRESDLPITEIATACGFCNPSYFCKVFRGLTGLSPREFRKKK